MFIILQNFTSRVGPNTETFLSSSEIWQIGKDSSCLINLFLKYTLHICKDICEEMGTYNLCKDIQTNIPMEENDLDFTPESKVIFGAGRVCWRHRFSYLELFLIEIYIGLKKNLSKRETTVWS